MQPVPLAATTRGYPDSGFAVENVHAGSVAVVDLRGRLLWQAGDPHYPTFTRSALKPFQALPFILSDGPARFGLTRDELALLCASHSGEERHLAGVRSILGKIGLDESHLECGCATPLYYEAMGQPAPQDRTWTQLHHNCSGKHSGFLAWCRLRGAPTQGYVDRAHPLQQAILSTLADAAGLPAQQMPSGIDGCSAPNYAMPLSRLAHLYARLAQGPADAQLGGAMGVLFDAMTGRPDMVSGEERTDLFWMTAGGGDWVAKIGADAVQAIGIRSAGIGIAIKIQDGASRALHPATYSVLEQLGLLDDARRALLERYRQPAIRNARGTVAGDVRPLFTLQRAG
ncbi:MULTISPECIES: asparaginase [unclassified Massilia]|uniref:asparaginase n=1 Tax=unclassified Massilia TaxID=2609279 RepID=UPI001B817F45|nr:MULTISPECIES: asparaginase [unclassified Massilia]MBQ5942371.1 asparaginase [Massilia sp. AB1]MBQ5963979.1 asparaginase [Massilia sp. ZL223]